MITITSCRNVMFFIFTLPCTEFDVFTRDWMLVDVATNNQRAKTKRLRDKMAMIATKAKVLLLVTAVCVCVINILWSWYRS